VLNFQWLFGGRYRDRTYDLSRVKGGYPPIRGHQIIKRFSEDIDIRIEPAKGSELRTGRNHNNAKELSPMTVATAANTIS
jgi:hypothetical protein